jgi:glycosyltransferase involved in cell wall biosynthesis
MAGGMVSSLTVLLAVRDTPPGILRQAIVSIRRQSLREFEFLILDDGSRQPETCRELERQAAADSRIRLEREPPRGLTTTLNRGLARAAGELIARQDADDWSEPDRLARQTAFLAAHPHIALCGSNAWTHREDGRPLWATRLPEQPAAIREALWKGNPFFHGSTLFRTGIARELGGYRAEFRSAQDYDFFWRMSDAGGGANLADPLYHYRYNAGAVSARRAAEQARAHRAAQLLAAARRSGAVEDVARALDQAEREIVDAGPSAAALKQIDHRLLAGDFSAAGRAYAGLVRTHPQSRLAWGKLLRWAVFAAVPPAREWCFR